MELNTDKPVGIGEFLKRSKFSVPDNQRSYSWKPAQIDDLFDDLGGYLNSGDYFLGWIVLSREWSDERPTIVDGQQRLASICMIYAAIRDYLVEHGKGEIAGKLANALLYIEDEWTPKREPRVFLSPDDHSFFASYVIADLGSETRSRIKITPTSPHSHRRIAKAFARVKERVTAIAANTEDPIQALSQWDKLIRDRAKIIPLYVSDDLTAFQIFETLNDRGLDLTIADLLKNYVYKLSGDRIEESKLHWNRAISRVISQSRETMVTKFIHHFWSSKRGLTRERELYKSIRETVKTEDDALAFVAELDSSSAHYEAILNSDADLWKHLGNDGKELVGTLLKLKFDQYKPLLLACLDVFEPEKSDELRKILKLLVSWGVRFQVTNQLGSSRLELFYPNAAKLVREHNVKTAKALVDKVGAEVPSDAVFRQDFARFEEDNAIAARYLLAETNNRIGQDAGDAENHAARQLTLEHILPKSESIPGGMDFSKDTADVYRYRLGNQTLLLEKANRSLGISEFRKKLDVYKKSKLPITNQLAKYRKWSSSAIDERQQWLADVAVRVWPAKL